MDNKSIAKNKGLSSVGRGSITGGKNVHPLLIPLKFKISKNYLNTLSIIGRLGEKSKEYHNYYLKLYKASRSSKINKESQLKAIAKLNIFLLECLKYEKKRLLRDAYAEEALIQQGWIYFHNSVLEPIYSFQDLYFDFIHKESLITYFGESLAFVVEEVLRDDFITKNESDYLLEKAAELGIPQKRMESLLKDYFKTNPALKKLIYEICKDGKITETEKNYLLEKKAQYKISDDKIIAEIESTLNIINNIRVLFGNENFYNLVMLLFVNKFLDSTDSVHFQRLAQQLNKTDFMLSNESILNDIKEIKPHLIEMIYISSNGGIAKNATTTTEDLVKLLGIEMRSHLSIQKDFKSEPCEFSIGELPELFAKNKADSEYKFDDQYKFGSTVFEFNYIKDKNSPLFCYDSLGEKVIISINKYHFFYNDSEIFKIWLISTVINLKKNYANEELIEEIQHLLNPAASIRLKISKKGFV